MSRMRSLPLLVSLRDRHRHSVHVQVGQFLLLLLLLAACDYGLDDALDGGLSRWAGVP